MTDSLGTNRVVDAAMGDIDKLLQGLRDSDDFGDDDPLKDVVQTSVDFTDFGGINSSDTKHSLTGNLQDPEQSLDMKQSIDIQSWIKVNQYNIYIYIYVYIYYLPTFPMSLMSYIF